MNTHYYVNITSRMHYYNYILNIISSQIITIVEVVACV